MHISNKPKYKQKNKQMKQKLRNLLGAGLFAFLAPVTLSAQAPTASFTVPASACQGQTVQITDVSTDTPTSWSYTIEGVGVETSQNPLVTFTMAGVYNITLIASNASGDSGPAVQTITVNALPVVTAPAQTDVCAGGFITLSGAGASSYVWTGGVNDGVAFAPSTSTTYVVTGTDANGCSSSASASVTVNALPVVSISGTNAVCLGGAVTLTASGADSFLWQGVTNNSEFTDSPTVNTTYTVVGTNAVTNCTNSASQAVTVNALPTVTVNSAAVCQGVTFTMVPGGAQSYVFSNGSATVNASANSSYTVTGTDANGCVASAVSELTVNPLPVVSVNSGSVCSGSVFTLNPTGALTYSYSTAGNSNTVAPTANASYTVTGTDGNGCVSVDAIANVTVAALPVVTVNSGTICAGGVFTINPTGASSFTFVTGASTVSPSSNTSYSIIGSDNTTGCVSQPAISSVSVFALPVVSVSNGTICAGSVYTLSPSGAATYIFSSGSNTVNPAANTSYSITGVSAEGCQSSSPAVASLTVYALPVVSVTSGTICQGGVYTMTASGANTYVYSTGASTISPASSTTVGVTGISAEGCASSNTAVASIQVNSLPAITIGTVAPICVGEPAVLVLNGAVTYTWNTTSNDVSYTVSPVSTTGYTVVGTDANGCSNSASYTVVVNPLPTVTVNNGTICPGGSFTINPTGASNYVISGGSSVVSPNTTTSYSVIGVDMNGCISPVAVLTVNVVNALTITVSGNTTICNGQTATLTANGATTYSWSNNNTNGTLIVTPVANTSYTVTGISSGCSNTAVVSVVVNALPTLSVSGTPSLICAGESVVLTAFGATSYQWDGTPGTASYTVSPSVTTNYTLTGTDANSCSNTLVYSQQVQDCTGLPKNGTLSSVSVFPNPSNGEFFIQLTESAAVEVINGLGQVVLAANLSEGQSSLNLNTCPKGIYFVQIKKADASKIIKIVKN